MAQGWVTASDRLWQMDMARRLPAGEAAEVLGSVLLPHDRLERTLGMRDVADRMVRTLPADQLAQLNAYARGVNAYIAHGVLPAEFSLLLLQAAPVASRKIPSWSRFRWPRCSTQRWQAKLKREQLTARLDANTAWARSPPTSTRPAPGATIRRCPAAPGISDPQDVPQIPLDPSQVRLETPPILPVQKTSRLALRSP